MQKRLYRSQIDRKIAGVCGGVAEYFEVDPTFVRIIALVLILAHGIGLIAYIIAWIAMPKRPFEFVTAEAEPGIHPTSRPHDSTWNHYLPGIILVVIGMFFLMDHLFWWFGFSFALSIVLILLGALFLVTATRNHSHNNIGPHQPEVSK